MDKADKTALQSLYEDHHVTGERLRQSFMEQERGALFSGWIGKDRRVLDLGGRDGILTKYYTDGNRVTIGDVDEQAMTYAGEKLGVDTAYSDLNQRLPFDDGSFDVVVLAEVLEHLPYPMITLKEINRVLVSGGKFIGNIPLAYHLKDRYQVLRGRKLVMAGDPTHLQFYKYDELESLLARFFSIREIRILKGGKKAERFPGLFARNVAFHCEKIS